MEPTRLQRLHRKPSADSRITQPLPVAEQQTRIKPAAASRSAGLAFEQRVTLFTHSIARDRASSLLDGFSRDVAETARAFLAEHAAQPSAERQGRLAAEFGIRTDASQGLRDVWAEAGPALRWHIYDLLPPYHRSVFPDYAPGPPPDAAAQAPGLRDFAERLVREATR